jgi:hypothetical protein
MAPASEIAVSAPSTIFMAGPLSRVDPHLLDRELDAFDPAFGSSNVHRNPALPPFLAICAVAPRVVLLCSVAGRACERINTAGRDRAPFLTWEMRRRHRVNTLSAHPITEELWTTKFC